MDQRAAAGADVHEQRLVLGQEEAVRRRRALAVEADGVVDVAVGAAQQPDVDDVRRLAHVEVALEVADGPVDRLGVMLEARRGFVADDEERARDAGRDSRRGISAFFFSFITCCACAAGVTPERNRARPLDVDLAWLQHDADRQPVVARVLERPQLQEARARHPLVGAAVLAGLVIDDFVRGAVEAEDQAKVLGRVRRCDRSACRRSTGRRARGRRTSPPAGAASSAAALAAATLFQTGPGRKPNASTARFSSGVLTPRPSRGSRPARSKTARWSTA